MSDIPEIDPNQQIKSRSSKRPDELNEALDDFTLKSAKLLWEIASDDDHPWHKRFGFEALKTLFSKVTPVRKDREVSAPNQTVNLQALFHGNSLPTPVEVKEIPATETKELTDGE